MVLTKKFEFLITPQDYEVLKDLSRHYQLSKAAILRLAIHDLHQKLGGSPVTPLQTTNPVLRSPTTPPPPELDPFWQEFGK